MADPESALLHEVAESGLLDPDWYLAHHHDVAAAGLEPLLHFVRFGLHEGRAPNRYCDPLWYAAENPDVAATDLPAFLHYVRHGEAEGRLPHPLFDPAWYRQSYGLPPDAPALRHFLPNRESGVYAPCPALAAVTLMPEWRGADAVDRYLEEMDRIAPGTLPDPGIVRASGLLDPNHYLINASDVLEAGMDPVTHYCLHGWRENRHPNLYFDPAWYIATNPDLAQRRMNPLVHYVLLGEPSGRRPVPYFEPLWYREAHDVPPGMTALSHYLEHRRGQAVSPHPLFDVAWYVARHQEDLGPNRDPFAHYLVQGTLADIDPSPRFDARSYRRRFLGRPSRHFGRMMTPNRHNPLVHYLLREYTRPA